MNHKSNILNQKSYQSGQSLLESIIILPLFMLVLGGVVVIFQQGLRKVQDDYSAIAIAYSDVFITQEEKQAGRWYEAEKSQKNFLKKVTHFLANPSAGFASNVDTKEGVFLDKARVGTGSSSVLSASSDAQDSTHVKFETQAGQKGYERRAFFQEGFFPTLLAIPHRYNVASVFLEQPQDKVMLWENRSSLSQYAYALHRMQAIPFATYSFDAQAWADLAAKYGSTLQESWCYGEAAASCVKQGGGALWAQCMALKTALLTQAISFQHAPHSVCPRVVQTIKGARGIFKGIVVAKSASQDAQEFLYAAELRSKLW